MSGGIDPIMIRSSLMTRSSSHRKFELPNTNRGPSPIGVVKGNYYLKKPQQDLLKKIFETVKSGDEQKIQLLSNTLKKYGINVACDPFQIQKKDGIVKSLFNEFMRIADHSMTVSQEKDDIVVFSQGMEPIPSLVKRIMENNQCEEILNNCNVRAYSQLGASPSYVSNSTIKMYSSDSEDAFESPPGPSPIQGLCSKQLLGPFESPPGPSPIPDQASEQSVDHLTPEEEDTWRKFWGTSLNCALRAPVEFFFPRMFSRSYESGLYHIPDQASEQSVDHLTPEEEATGRKFVGTSLNNALHVKIKTD
tara:strand:+ start:1426 stop:2343 length:918 start_codon:yes stop_codon:yes gene_type:complete